MRERKCKMAEVGQIDIERMETYVTGALTLNIDQTINEFELLILQMQMSGMTESQIKAVLINDLQTGGKIFGGYRAGVRNIVKEAVQMASTDGSIWKYQQKGVKRFKWIVMFEGNQPCPDCKPRHNRIDTMAHWRDVGLPGSGFSICRQFCKCKLTTVLYKGKDLEKPLNRKRK